MALSGIIKTVLAVLVIVMAAMLYPPIRLSALVLAGRSPVCPMSQAVKAEKNLEEQISAKDRILKASKLIAKDENYEQWQTPKGTYWIEKNSRFVLPFNLAEQERKIYGSGSFFVQPGDTVLDCGANVGVFVREALNAGATKIIAIEPAPENIEVLKRNFAPEIGQGRVIVYPKGVWDKDDFLSMNIDHGNSAADSFVLHPEHSMATTEKMPLTTIDKLVAELKLDRVDFIKMDIEGAEVKALTGGKGTIERHHPRIAVSVYHEPGHPVEVPRAIRAAWSGYRMECGPCALQDNSFIRPDVLWFHN